jgi:hypothetical protein
VQCSDPVDEGFVAEGFSKLIAALLKGLRQKVR